MYFANNCCFIQASIRIPQLKAPVCHARLAKNVPFPPLHHLPVKQVIIQC